MFGTYQFQPPAASGLTNAHYEVIMRYVQECFKHLSVRIYLFGSRSRGQYRSGSDIDLAFESSQSMEREIALLQDKLEESTLPYHFDLVNMQYIDKTMRETIQREGILLWTN